MKIFKTPLGLMSVGFFAVIAVFFIGGEAVKLIAQQGANPYNVRTISSRVPEAYNLLADQFELISTMIDSTDSGKVYLIGGPIRYRSRISSTVMRVLESGQVDSAGKPNGVFYIYTNPKQDFASKDSLRKVDTVRIDTGRYVYADLGAPLSADCTIAAGSYIFAKYTIPKQYGVDTQIVRADSHGGRYGALHDGRPDSVFFNFIIQRIPNN